MASAGDAREDISTLLIAELQRERRDWIATVGALLRTNGGELAISDRELQARPEGRIEFIEDEENRRVLCRWAGGRAKGELNC